MNHCTNFRWIRKQPRERKELRGEARLLWPLLGLFRLYSRKVYNFIPGITATRRYMVEAISKRVTNQSSGACHPLWRSVQFGGVRKMAIILKCVFHLENWFFFIVHLFATKGQKCVC